MYGSKKKRQNKNIGGNVMSAIRRQARKEGFMTGQDDERDIKEFLQTKATNAMFDEADKKEKKKPKKRTIDTKRKKRKVPVDMKRVKKAADSLRMMGGGKVHDDKKKKGMMGGGKMYTSMNKRYANGGKIYPSKGKS